MAHKLGFSIENPCQICSLASLDQCIQFYCGGSSFLLIVCLSNQVSYKPSFAFFKPKYLFLNCFLPYVYNQLFYIFFRLQASFIGLRGSLRKCQLLIFPRCLTIEKVPSTQMSMKPICIHSIAKASGLEKPCCSSQPWGCIIPAPPSLT